jgi:diaminohydroxyphosphoribosylaminopyrimidine deaminase/5-amino-6-(5-phosphoribosylamino)uracil reductase
LVATAREIPIIVAATEEAPSERCAALADHGCAVIRLPGTPRVPLVPLLAELGRRELTNILVEGGGKVLGAFLDDGLVDQVDVFIAPIIEGGDHPRTPARGKGVGLMSEALRLEDVSCSELDGDLRVQGIVPQPWRSRLSPLGKNG